VTKVEIKTLPSNTGKEILPCIEIMNKDMKIIWKTNSEKNFGNDEDSHLRPQESRQERYKVDKDKRMTIDLRDVRN
jgi:hypothetical protein